MIKVGIVDDHAVVRSGLRQFLSDEADLCVVGEAGSGKDALEMLAHTEVDVLVLDLSMPGQNGVDVLASIRARAPDVMVLILSGYPEEYHAVNLILNGARCYLNKECEPTEILQAIRAISNGERYITPEVQHLLEQHSRGSGS